MAVLEVENVSIRYMTGDFKEIGLKEYVLRRIKGEYRVREFWADRNISFSLEKGDMLGIIGTNGAGKSTLPAPHPMGCCCPRAVASTWAA